MSSDIKKIIREVLLEQGTAQAELPEYRDPLNRPLNLNMDGVMATDIKKWGVDSKLSDSSFEFYRKDCETLIAELKWKSDIESCISYQREAISSNIQNGSVFSFVHGVTKYTGCWRFDKTVGYRVFGGYFGTIGKDKHCYAPLWGYKEGQKNTDKSGIGGNTGNEIKIALPDIK